jgi:hypothetical protein
VGAGLLAKVCCQPMMPLAKQDALWQRGQMLMAKLDKGEAF